MSKDATYRRPPDEALAALTARLGRRGVAEACGVPYHTAIGWVADLERRDKGAVWRASPAGQIAARVREEIEVEMADIAANLSTIAKASVRSVVRYMTADFDPTTDPRNAARQAEMAERLGVGDLVRDVLRSLHQGVDGEERSLDDLRAAVASAVTRAHARVQDAPTN